MGIIECKDVCKSFGEKVALDHVSLEIPKGKIFGLLGPNGAGKTTLIRIINRITIPSGGTILFDGRPITQEDVEKIGYLPEERGLYRKMKVGDQAMYFAQLKGMSSNEARMELMKWFKRFGIESWWNKKVSELSKGMAQKIQFIVTILHEPELLIFDEPFSGFDPINANLLKNEILALRDKGATVIFSTHNMSSVEEVCDHITLINKSQNILSGSLDEVRRSHGGNIFEVDFRGNRDELVARLGSAPCRLLDTSVSDDEALDKHSSALKLHIPTDSDIRPIVGLINEAVELRSFREIIPSMNDVFIQAVANHSATTAQQK